jgi:hypothetical protein
MTDAATTKQLTSAERWQQLEILLHLAGQEMPDNWPDCSALRAQFKLDMPEDWLGYESHEWMILLLQHPQLITKMPKDTLTGHEWLTLLVRYPSLAEYLPRKLWEQLDFWQWWHLLWQQPQFAEKAPRQFWQQLLREIEPRRMLLQEQPQLSQYLPKGGEHAN